VEVVDLVSLMTEKKKKQEEVEHEADPLQV
jgi:hypothetical protein